MYIYGGDVSTSTSQEQYHSYIQHNSQYLRNKTQGKLVVGHQRKQITRFRHEWGFLRSFSVLAEAVAFIKDYKGFRWRKATTTQTKFGIKAYYICRGSPVCKASLLLHYEDSNQMLLYESDREHSHDLINTVHQIPLLNSTQREQGMVIEEKSSATSKSVHATSKDTTFSGTDPMSVVDISLKTSLHEVIDEGEERDDGTGSELSNLPSSIIPLTASSSVSRSIQTEVLKAPNVCLRRNQNFYFRAESTEEGEDISPTEENIKELVLQNIKENYSNRDLLHIRDELQTLKDQNKYRLLNRLFSFTAGFLQDTFIEVTARPSESSSQQDHNN